jgi:hypothetical protein
LPPSRLRLRLEALEERLAPIVSASGLLLTYGGPGTALVLTENTTSNVSVTLSQSGNFLSIGIQGDVFASTSTAAVTGLVYVGALGTTQTATVDISAANNISTLQVNLTTTQDQLTLGLSNAAGGVGSISVTAAANGTDTVILNSLTLGNNSTAGNLTVTADSLTVNGSIDATTASSGNVALTAGGPAAGHPGLVLQGGLSIKTTSGTIDLTGTSGTGPGLEVQNFTLDAGSAGSIALTGTGKQDGVLIGLGAHVQDEGGGAVAISGAGLASSDDGVDIDGSSGGAQVTTSGGAITITGNGTGQNQGNVSVQNGAQLTTTGGNISITATAGSNALGAALAVETSSLVQAGGTGSVTLTGNNSNSIGVLVSGAQVKTAGGDLTVSGTGGTGSNPNPNYGVELQAGGVLQAGGTGKVIVNGTGGSSTGSNNHGIFINGNGAQIVTAGGDLTLTGTGGSGAGSSIDNGVDLEAGAVVKAGGTGKATLNGTAGTNGEGVFLNGTQVNTAGGNLALIGSGQGTGRNYGIDLEFGAVVQTNGAGNISLQGQAGAANTGGGVILASDPHVQALGTGSLAISGSSAGGSGVTLLGNGNNSGFLEVTTANGNLTIAGTGAAAGYGVEVESGALLQAGGSGNLGLQGQAAPGTAAISIDANTAIGVSRLQVNTGNVTLTGDIIDLGAPGSVNSTSTTAHSSQVLFQPFTASRPLILGGDNVAGSLVFTNADLAAVAQSGTSGFALLTLGAAVGTGAVTVASGGITFSTNATVETPGPGSAGIVLANPINDTGNTLTLNSGGTITGSANPAVTSACLIAQAGTGIGSTTSMLHTAVAGLEAKTGTGGIFLTNTGALTLGCTPTTLGTGATAVTAGDITIQTTGAMIINQALATPGNISLTGSGVITVNAAVTGGTSATVHGSGAGNTLLVNVPGTGTVQYQGSGSDTATLKAAGTYNNARLNLGSGSLKGTAYTWSVAGVTTLTVNAASATDSAAFADTSGTNTYIGTPTYSTLSGGSDTTKAVGFKSVGISSTSGNDIAYLYEAPGNATYFVGTPTYSFLSTLAGTILDEVIGCKSVIATGATGTTDPAYLYDFIGSNTFNVTPTTADLITGGVVNEATGFKYVVVNSKSGHDVGNFYDTPGSNTFIGTPGYSYLVSAGTFDEVIGFQSATATAPAGGNDTATLLDTTGSGANTFVATTGYSYLSAGGIVAEVIGFTSVTANATAGGTDSAYLYEGTGETDTFAATPSYAYLSGSGHFREAIGFKLVIGYAAAGSADTAYLYGSTGNDTFTGTPASSGLQGPGFYNQALGFPSVLASGGGNDTANLSDGPGGGTFIGQGSSADLSGPGFGISLDDFAKVIATGSTGINHRNVGAINYLFSTVGAWV